MCDSCFNVIADRFHSALERVENRIRCGDFEKAAKICAGIVAQMVKFDLSMPDEAADGLTQDIQYVCRYYKAYYGSKDNGGENDKHDTL